MLRIESHSLSKVRVIVDALDEVSPEGSRDHFIHLLETLVESCPIIGLLIVSRPLPLIQRHTPNAVELNVIALPRDILHHVRRKIDRDRRMICDFVEGDESMKEEIALTVAEQAAGMYVLSSISVGVKRVKRQLILLP